MGVEDLAVKREDKEQSPMLTVTLTAEEGKEEEAQAVSQGAMEHFQSMVGGAMFCCNVGLPALLAVPATMSGQDLALCRG